MAERLTNTDFATMDGWQWSSAEFTLHWVPADDTYDEGTEGARITLGTGANYMKSELSGNVDELGAFTTEPVAGESYTLTLDIADNGTAGADFRVDLRVGATVIATTGKLDTNAPKWEWQAVSLTGAVDSGYVFDGTNGINVLVWVQEPYGTYAVRYPSIDGPAPAPPVVVDDPGELALYLDQAYTLQLTGSTTGTLPLSWEALDELPAGIVLGSDGVLGGTPTELGSGTVTVQATDADSSTATRELSWSVALPPDPLPALLAELAGRTAAYVGRAGDAAAEAVALAQLPIVVEFVRGYTRGVGFDPDGVPAMPLQAVIVAAAGRLLTNPEQLTSYQTADYSERPAVLDGWKLPELAVLHRYRKRWS